MESDIFINNKKFNVFWHTDALLLTRLTTNGTKKLIINANLYILDHGLGLKPVKDQIYHILEIASYSSNSILTPLRVTLKSVINSTIYIIYAGKLPFLYFVEYLLKYQTGFSV